MGQFKSKTGTFKTGGKTFPTISIFEFDENGFQKYKNATITIGVKKAKAVLATIDEIKKFIEENMSEDELKAMADAQIQQILAGEEDGSAE